MKFRIDLFAKGNIRQVIKLNGTITPKEFLIGLQSGKYATTIGHGVGNGNVIQVEPDFRVVGKVLDQTPLADVDLTDFEILPD